MQAAVYIKTAVYCSLGRKGYITNYRKDIIMKRKRNLAGKFIFIMFLPVFMALAVLPALRARAAYAGSDNMIGLYDGEVKGESIPGKKQVMVNGNIQEAMLMVM